MATDADRDLALLTPVEPLTGGLRIDSDTNLKIGNTVTTWGFPLGYDGPAPLLSVGYLAGFIDRTANGSVIKHLVVNGAFNPGNSGGPLFCAGDDRVVGVVVSKHAPMSKFHLDAIQALMTNDSGVMFQAYDEQGHLVDFVESQLVGDILMYFRNLTQVMIGEAIAAEEVGYFLAARGLDS